MGHIVEWRRPPCARRRPLDQDKQGFEAIDPVFRRIALEKFAEYDGSRSRPNLQEIERQIRVALKNEGVEDPNLPDRLVQEFLSQHWRATGSTVRAQRSKSLRKVAGHESYPAQHPGELATDLTLVNNFVLDPLQERAINVEVGVIHSIATRVIHGIRVFPVGRVASTSGCSSTTRCASSQWSSTAPPLTTSAGAAYPNPSTSAATPSTSGAAQPSTPAGRSKECTTSQALPHVNP